MVDEKKIAMTPAVEISYLKPGRTGDILTAIDSEGYAVALAGAAHEKARRRGKLSDDTMLDIMMEQKKPEQYNVTISGDKLRKYFPRSYTPRMEETILKLLDAWLKAPARAGAMMELNIRITASAPNDRIILRPVLSCHEAFGGSSCISAHSNTGGGRGLPLLPALRTSAMYRGQWLSLHCGTHRGGRSGLWRGRMGYVQKPVLRFAERLRQITERFSGMWSRQDTLSDFSAFANTGLRKKRDTKQFFAALYLLSANEDIWHRAYNCFSKKGLSFDYLRMRGIALQDYSLVQAAKALYLNSDGFTIADLEDCDAVNADSFALIINAILIADFGMGVTKIRRQKCLS